MGTVPAGTGNAIARSIDCPDPASATLNIIKGNARSMDLCTVRQEGSPLLWSHLAFFWGLLADIDIESEE